MEIVWSHSSQYKLRIITFSNKFAFVWMFIFIRDLQHKGGWTVSTQRTHKEERVANNWPGMVRALSQAEFSLEISMVDWSQFFLT
jgi:hypothetical protein